MTNDTAPHTSYYRTPVPLGELHEWMGNTVADVSDEFVTVRWAGGERVDEVREVRTSGKVALAVPAGGF